MVANCLCLLPSTYVDIAFFPWNNLISWIFDDQTATLVPEAKYPNFWAWHKRVMDLPSVQAALAVRDKAT